MEFPRPQPLVNPLLSGDPLTGWEILAGPLGVLAFLPFIPLVRAIAAYSSEPRAALTHALTLASIIWLFATAGPLAGAILTGWLLAGFAWIAALGRLRSAGRLSRRGMIALVWLGMHALVFPLWWQAYPSWSPSRMPPMHAMGFAYLMLRMIGWGMHWANNPDVPLWPGRTLSWLFYAPCMRSGPVLRREDFFARLECLTALNRSQIVEVGARLLAGLCGLGLLVIAAKNTPHAVPGAPDYFISPQNYETRHLLRAMYLIPIQIYLFLWSYSEIAIALSIACGIRADENFNRLPRAASVRDFWRRWHISLGSWLRDYMYIPLGGNRGFAGLGPVTTPVNYFLVFVYIGVWHGASWSLAAWGASQALGLTAQFGWDRLRERLGWSDRPRGRAWAAFCWLLTMHYQFATITMLADFTHVGTRFFPELISRAIGAG